ncbi:MAG: lipopolysaccharide biosynthesis protein [Microbacterium sp.]
MPTSDEGSFRRRVLVGAGWLGASRIASQFVQFLVGLILARLLTPTEFGIFASVIVISGFGVLLFEGGLRAALVHAESPSQRDFSTVFWLNLGGGVVLAIIMASIGPLLADFYDQPVLTSLSPIVGLTFACSTGVVNAAKLQRELRFGAAAILESSCTIAGLLVTLVMALMGAGVYSLAVGPVVSQILVSSGYAILHPWKPDLAVSWESIRRLMRYSLPLLASNVTDYWGRNADKLLIGRFVGAAPLGFYSRAYNLMLLPLTQITQSVGGAVSPALARMNADPARAGLAYLRSIRLLSMLTITIMVAFAATAPALVEVLWGSRWQPAAPLLQVLALAGIPQCIQVTCAWLYQAQGRTATMFRMTLLFTAISIALMVFGLQWGAIGVCFALLVRYWVGLPFELAVAIRRIDLTLGTVILAILKVLVPVLVVGAAVYLVAYLLPFPPTSLQTLGVQLGLGAVLTVANLVLLQRDLLNEILPSRFRKG